MSVVSYSHPGLRKVVEVLGNDNCVDCGSENPQYACLLNAVLLCFNCAGFHRSFGNHISVVKSLIADAWVDKEISILKVGGNLRFLKNLSEYNLIDIDNPFTISPEKSREKYLFVASDYYRNLIDTEANHGSRPLKPDLEEGKLFMEGEKREGEVVESQQPIDNKENQKLTQKVKAIAGNAYTKSKHAVKSTAHKINNSELTKKIKTKGNLAVNKVGNAGFYISNKASNIAVSY